MEVIQALGTEQSQFLQSKVGRHIQELLADARFPASMGKLWGSFLACMKDAAFFVCLGIMISLILFFEKRLLFQKHS